MCVEGFFPWPLCLTVCSFGRKTLKFYFSVDQISYCFHDFGPERYVQVQVVSFVVRGFMQFACDCFSTK